MKKYAVNGLKVIQFAIKYAPIIMVIVEALKMVQTEAKRIADGSN